MMEGSLSNLPFDINPAVAINFLTQNECERLVQYFLAGEKISGKIRSEARKTDDSPAGNLIRKNTICWLNRNEDTSWIYNKLTNFVEQINEKKYHFQIETLQPIQLAEYRSSATEEGEFYKPHLDICMRGLTNEQRKLSISVQLTSPDEYEGGDLLFFGDQNDMLLDPKTFGDNLLQRRKLGSAIIFPSLLQHQITPLVNGTRYSLVAWVQGPNWV